MSSNFGLKEVGSFKYHRPYKYADKTIVDRYNCIYLVRDLRDVLIATWHYWLNPGVEPTMNVRPLLKGKSISEFIRGISSKELNKAGFRRKNRVQKIIYEHLNDPVQHWVDYAEWSEVLYTVRFEDLKSSQENVLKKIKNRFGLSFVRKKFKPIKKLVGLFPRKGAVGEWKGILNKEDKKYITSKAEKQLLKFGYKV
jgi:hypothetical protein